LLLLDESLIGYWRASALAQVGAVVDGVTQQREPFVTRERLDQVLAWVAEALATGGQHQRAIAFACQAETLERFISPEGQADALA
jgi:hypothetical protein